jgi:hypothetical protein
MLGRQDTDRPTFFHLLHLLLLEPLVPPFNITHESGRQPFYLDTLVYPFAFLAISCLLSNSLLTR